MTIKTEPPISWDQLWLETARLAAKRSRCTRDQVGAVLVSHDNRALSVSYNGAPATFTGDTGFECAFWCPRAMNVPRGEGGGHPEYHDCPAQHAEANAILRSPAVDSALGVMFSTFLYVSTVPCMSCAKMIGVARTTKNLRRVVCSQGGIGDGYRNQGDAVDFMQQCGVSVSLV